MNADLLHPTDGNNEEDFDLDVRFADHGPALTELMNSTSDKLRQHGCQCLCHLRRQQLTPQRRYRTPPYLRTKRCSSIATSR